MSGNNGFEEPPEMAVNNNNSTEEEEAVAAPADAENYVFYAPPGIMERLVVDPRGRAVLTNWQLAFWIDVVRDGELTWIKDLMILLEIDKRPGGNNLAIFEKIYIYIVEMFDLEHKAEYEDSIRRINLLQTELNERAGYIFIEIITVPRAAAGINFGSLLAKVKDHNTMLYLMGHGKKKAGDKTTKFGTGTGHQNPPHTINFDKIKEFMAGNSAYLFLFSPMCYGKCFVEEEHDVEKLVYIALDQDGKGRPPGYPCQLCESVNSWIRFYQLPLVGPASELTRNKYYTWPKFEAVVTSRTAARPQPHERGFYLQTATNFPANGIAIQYSINEEYERRREAAAAKKSGGRYRRKLRRKTIKRRRSAVKRRRNTMRRH